MKRSAWSSASFSSGIGIGDLAAADEQLEAVGDARVFVVAAGQRRDLEGVAGDEVRLLQLVLHQFLENHHLQLAQASWPRTLAPAFLAMARAFSTSLRSAAVISGLYLRIESNTDRRTNGSPKWKTLSP